jgi:CHASE2 domain-containing sensor protein/serine/threonine protein kinase
LVASLTVTGLLLFGRQLSLLEPLELSAFDQLMQLRPAVPPDPRLLVVKVTEPDIQSYPPYPLTDAVINQLLTNLEKHQPAVIGLDIYRDLPQQPGNAELSTQLRTSDRIIAMCQRKNAENRDVAPPPGVPESRIGFNDIPVDRGGVVRRALLFITLAPSATSRCTTQSSFGFQLARQYLKTQKGIEPELLQQDEQEYLSMGRVAFKPLIPNAGGYQHGDTGGYQILLNYRSRDPVGDSLARSVTLSDVLNNRIDPSWVKNRIVLIGVTAASVGDAFYTPYSQARRIQRMPGVVVHGQIVSQLLSAVLDGQRLFWFWPEWGEVLWIWSWSLIGGILVRVFRHPGKQLLAESLALGLLLGTSVALFIGSGWIPVVAPTLGLIAATTGVLAYNAYEAERERLKAEKERLYIEQKAQEQEKNIALLQNLLKERTYTPSPSPSPTKSNVPLREEKEETELPSDDESEGDTVAWSTGAGNNETEAEERSEGSSTLLAGHYRLGEVLGSGGFGLTYLAQDTHRPGAPECVVKRLRPARRDERFLQVARRLFDTEAEILEKLGHHPQIPRLLAHFEERQEFYLVQEYVDGHPLTDELPVDKRVPEVQVIELLQGVLEILMFIHEHKVIHRDIKPGNIMRRHQDGKVVLIDFGAVKQIQPQQQADQENPTVAIGTRGYAPPEQYAGHPSFNSDIYALGMIGIQALTGIPTHQLPFSSETGDVSWRHLANASDDFARIVEKMVRYHFAARYQSAAEVIEDLKPLRSSL